MVRSHPSCKKVRCGYEGCKRTVLRRNMKRHLGRFHPGATFVSNDAFGVRKRLSSRNLKVPVQSTSTTSGSGEPQTTEEYKADFLQLANSVSSEATDQAASQVMHHNSGDILEVKLEHIKQEPDSQWPDQAATMPNDDLLEVKFEHIKQEPDAPWLSYAATRQDDGPPYAAACLPASLIIKQEEEDLSAVTSSISSEGSCDLGPVEVGDWKSHLTDQEPSKPPEHDVTERFKCRELVFAGRKRMRIYLPEENSQKNPNKCEYCGRTYTRRRFLIIHQRKRCTQKLNAKLYGHFPAPKTRSRLSYRCENCLKTCPSQMALNRHIATHVGSEPFICGECGLTFCDRVGMVVHVREHRQGKRYRCEKCGNTFAKKLELAKHRKKHEDERRQKRRARGESETAVTSQVGTDDCHRDIVSQKLDKCSECGKCVPLEGDPKQSMESHTHLTKCHDCAQASSQHPDHPPRDHSPPAHKPFSCDQCGKSFSSRANLGSHKRVHSNPNHHVCDVCSKEFRSAEKLASHRRRHSLEFDPVCSQCGMGFMEWRRCHRHMRAHAMEYIGK